MFICYKLLFCYQMCQEQSSNLDNLATVMTLYSRGTFAKDSFQWTKCVVKYLYDVYAAMNDTLIAFLAEVSHKTQTKIEFRDSSPHLLPIPTYFSLHTLLLNSAKFPIETFHY